MARRGSGRTVTCLVVVTMSMVLTAQERDRSKVPDGLKWNLADVYPDRAAWRTRKEAVAAELPSLRRWKGNWAPRRRRSPMPWS